MLNIKFFNRPEAPGPFKNPWWNKLMIVLLPVLLITAVAGGYYWLNNSGYFLNAHYKKTQSYMLSGPQKTMGMSFLIPTAVTDRSDLPTTKNYINFAQNVVHKGKVYSLFTQAASISEPFEITQLRLKSIDSLVPDPTKATDQYDVANIHSFVRARLNSRYSLQLGSAEKFSNPYIKKDAWLVNFKATDSKTTRALTPKQMNGQVIMAAGKKNMYYLMLASIERNWQSNQITWNQIKNSLKIDQ